MSSWDEKLLLNIGEVDWAPPYIHDDVAVADDFIYNDTKLVKFVPNYTTFFRDKPSSVILYDDPSSSKFVNTCYQDKRSTGTNRHKYKAKKVKELRPLKYTASKCSSYDIRKTLDPSKFSEASLLSQIDFSKSWDLLNGSTHNNLTETTKPPFQYSYIDSPASVPSSRMCQLPTSESNQNVGPGMISTNVDILMLKKSNQ